MLKTQQSVLETLANSRWKEGCTLVEALVLGSLPDGKAEGDLVDEICKVVDEVQAAVIDTTHEVAKEVAGWVNGPTCSDNETHGAERGLGELVGRSKLASNGSGLATEDLEEDEEPTAHATSEAHPGTTRAQVSLSSVAEHKHDHSSDQELPERSLGDLVAHGRQDEVELNHLQWHCDSPVDVAVENWGCVDQHPELAHVE